MRHIKNTVGIVGKGFVGGAMFENFKDIFQTFVWDTIEAKRNVATFNDFVEKSDVIFVCVPTPMKNDGSCETNIIDSVIKDIAAINTQKCIVIKSTVVPGTTERLASTYKVKIWFNPEFLTEANSINDFRNQPLIVIGADDPDTASVMANIYSRFNSSINIQSQIIQRTTKEAELIKYFANSFLATKVIFANEFKRLCDQINVDYNRIVEILSLDKRLGHTHWQVPGPDGKFGFGGSCFPKDTSALLCFADSLSSPLRLLTEAVRINQNIRHNT